MAKRKSNKRSGKKTAVAKPKAAKTTEAVENKLTKAEQFRLDYAYVLQDLRTVFILAGIMFALLIALNLFLQ